MYTLFIGIREVVQNILRPLALVGWCEQGFGFWVSCAGWAQEPGRRLGSVDGSGLEDQVHTPPLRTSPANSSTVLPSSSWVLQIIDGANCQMVEHLDSHLYVVRGRSKGGN